eukprot:GGOE01057909.1.p1 GENE.GGOE01057909.1~~GGOE01057909.1.p1  ORF type:complete len:236 (-),score=45.78 GGOE01057909.1:142-828(-)
MDALCAQADQLHDQGKVQQHFNVLDCAIKQQKDNPDVVWRYARACFLLAEEKEEKEWQKTYFEKGLHQARHCVELDPKNAMGHKWVGILLGRLTNFVSTKEKVANAFLIRDCFLKALEQSPNDHTLYYGLGQWCWNVSNISWLERKAGALFFAAPPESSYEEAEQNYLKAAQLCPTFMDNVFALGGLYEAMKRKEDARIWYTKCLSIQAVTDSEKRMQAKAKQRVAAL